MRSASPSPSGPGTANRFPRLRRVAGEGVLLVGAQRALLMQIAHPTVAAGVDDHSDFTMIPLTRLAATLDAVLVMVWGTDQEAANIVERVSRRHDHVHGHLHEDAGARPADHPYSAHDRTAQLWVWATLVDTADRLFERYVRTYRRGERDAVYEDWQRFAVQFGISDRIVPATRAECDEYIEFMLHGDVLDVTATTRRVARNVLRPPVRWVPAPTWDVLEAVATAQLPEALRDRYGFPWGPRQRVLAGAVDGTLQLSWRRLPKARLALPNAYMRTRRTARRLRAAAA